MDQSALDALLHAAVVPEADHRSGKVDRASEILAASPDLAGRSIFAAAALGDVVALRAHLSRDPSLAVARGGARGWSPLLYLTFSLFLRDCPERAEEFASCARLLLEHGADANDYWISQSGERESAIYGAAGLANCPAVTRLLLDAGAKVTNPPDNEVLYHTAEHREHSCLRLILSAGPDADSLSYCMCHKMDQEDPEGLRLFISAGADVNYRLKGGVLAGYRPLHFAIFRRRSLKVMRILLDAGADPNLPADNGITPIQLAQGMGFQMSWN